jgi:hypothetical protein
MTKRRTRKQKEQAKHQYTLTSDYSASIPVAKNSQAKLKSTTFSAFDLYSYDTHLIRQDLLKTVLISSVILVLELSIYFIYFK